MKKVKVILAGIFILIVILGCFMVWEIYKQGVPSDFWSEYKLARVEFDESGIPTIEADSWENAIEAQGFVSASERLFQMDLIRRKTSGRLSEIFGEKALVSDLPMLRQNIESFANEVAKNLDRQDRLFCDLYAKGVNTFIEKFPGYWGLEYTIIGTSPEKWSCKDTVLVSLSLTSNLSNYHQREIGNKLWFDYLPTNWIKFLFPAEHPWAKPVLGKATKLKPNTLSNPINNKNLEQGELEILAGEVTTKPTIGSNSWVYRSKDNNLFLANDPHLSQSVPGIWLPMRLRLNKSDWIVGVSLPGTFGIVIGSNPHLSWGFTNTAVDADDLYSEKVDFERMKYLEKNDNGLEYWSDIESTTVNYKVLDKEKTLTAYRTSRGPLLELPIGSKNFYSRVWTGTQLKYFNSIPVLSIGRSKSVKELRENLKKLKFIAQNGIYADRNGNFGLTVTGTHYIKKVSGLTPQPGESYHQIKPVPISSPSYEITFNDQSNQNYLSVANQTLWVDQNGHYWSDEDRALRIRELLASTSNLNQTDMENMHLDEKSIFYKKLLNWLLENQKAENNPGSDLALAIKNWDGHLKSNEKLFYLATRIEKSLKSFVLNRLKNAFIPKKHHDEVKYSFLLKRSWLVYILEDSSYLKSLGTNTEEVCTKLFKNSASKYMTMPKYSEKNYWRSQHPFVKNIPLVGKLFDISEWPQHGHFGLLNVDSAKNGASVRLVWNQYSPLSSTWVFPVGVSGHIRSSHFSKFHELWRENKRIPIFPKNKEWEFFGSKLALAN